MLLPEVLKGQEHLQSFKFICSLLLSWSSVRQMDVPARKFPFRDLFNHKLMSMKTIDDTLALRISDARFSSFLSTRLRLLFFPANIFTFKI